MTKEWFESLSTDAKGYVTQGYIDGMQAAIEVVKSIKVKTHDDTIDDAFNGSKSYIIFILDLAYNKMLSNINNDNQINALVAKE